MENIYKDFNINKLNIYMKYLSFALFNISTPLKFWLIYIKNNQKKLNNH